MAILGSGAGRSPNVAVRRGQSHHARDAKMDKDAVWSLWKVLKGENLQHKPLEPWSKSIIPAAKNHLSFGNHLLLRATRP